jgi:hypothetical protein
MIGHICPVGTVFAYICLVPLMLLASLTHMAFVRRCDTCLFLMLFMICPSDECDCVVITEWV